MGWLFMAPALYGIWRYRYWAYWRPVLIILGVLELGVLLFWASGTYGNSVGDGVITAIVRNATHDGPETLWVALGVLGTIGVCLWLLRGVNRATLPPHPGREAADRADIPRKIVESIAIFAGVFALSFVVGGLSQAILYLMPNNTVRLSTPAVTSMSKEEQLRQAAALASADLPKRIDSVTTLTSMTTEGLIWTYHYDIEVAPSAAQLAELMSGTIRPQVCANPDMLAVMRMGATYRYSYRTPDRRILFEDVKLEDCEPPH